MTEKVLGIKNHWIAISLFAAIVTLLYGCKSVNKKGPDIKNVKLEIKVDHFENDFFNLDSNNLEKGLQKLKTKYGRFYTDFLFNIAAFSVEKTKLNKQLTAFLIANKSTCDSISYYIPDLNLQLKHIENALKRAKIYFPKLKTPDRLITYIGPIDGYGSFAISSNICIGLQQFMGARYHRYIDQKAYLESIYGAQRLKQFTGAYIAPSAIKAWINREFPDQPGHYTLKDKLLEEGRKAYLLKALLPNMPDSTIFGYDHQHMSWCKNNEILIKKYFEHENLLNTDSPEVIVTYISDNLRAEGLPEDFPDHIGKYLGFMMVRSYMENQNKTTLPGLMKLDLWEL